MTLRYLGHSAVSILTGKGCRIVIDPWLVGNPACPVEYQDPKKVDLIVLSHGHQDHSGGVADLAQRTGAKVCATWELCGLLGADGVPESQLLPMNKGGSLTLGAIRIALTQAFHSSSYVCKKGQTHYAGEACGVLLTLESGRVLYHAGDTSLFSDMGLIGRRAKIDIALVPIGDRFTMGPEDAAEAVGLLSPRVVIPIHYNTFPPIEVDPQRFVDAVAGRSEVRILNPGQEYSAQGG